MDYPLPEKGQVQRLSGNPWAWSGLGLGLVWAWSGLGPLYHLKIKQKAQIRAKYVASTYLLGNPLNNSYLSGSIRL